MKVDPRLLRVGSIYAYKRKIVKLLRHLPNGILEVERVAEADKIAYGSDPFKVLPSDLHYAFTIKRSKDGGI